MKYINFCIVLALLFSFSGKEVSANIKLSNLFSDHMVILSLEAAGISGNVMIKNLRDKTDLVQSGNKYKLNLPAHGAVLFSIRNPK